MISDDLSDKKLHYKTNMEHNLQHGLFLNFNEKRIVWAQQQNCDEDFSWNFLRKSFLLEFHSKFNYILLLVLFYYFFHKIVEKYFYMSQMGHYTHAFLTSTMSLSRKRTEGGTFPSGQRWNLKKVLGSCETRGRGRKRKGSTFHTLVFTSPTYNYDVIHHVICGKETPSTSATWACKSICLHRHKTRVAICFVMSIASSKLVLTTIEQTKFCSRW